MTSEDMEACYIMMGPLESESKMSMMESISYPHLKNKSDQDKVWSRLNKSIRKLDDHRMIEKSDSGRMSTADVAKMLSGRVNGHG